MRNPEYETLSFDSIPGICILTSETIILACKSPMLRLIYFMLETRPHMKVKINHLYILIYRRNSTLIAKLTRVGPAYYRRNNSTQSL